MQHISKLFNYNWQVIVLKHFASLIVSQSKSMETDILLVSKTKTDNSFPIGQLIIDDSSPLTDLVATIIVVV